MGGDDLEAGPSKTGVNSSPMKLIDGRSKCYKQLSDLHSLMSAGVLTSEEQKEAIMVTLEGIKQ